jgi:hypothetical protein
MTTPPTNTQTTTIETRREFKRACGWRQPGDLYLVGPKQSQPCGRLPQPIKPCPTCGHHLQFTLGGGSRRMAERPGVRWMGRTRERSRLVGAAVTSVFGGGSENRWLRSRWGKL